MTTASEQFSQTGVQVPVREERVLFPLWSKCAIFAGFFALALFLQYLSGAIRSEFSAYPDEPAHYVTSLMLREYITGPVPHHPVRFAEQYYLHYPKVALGHWPPVFYVIQAFWMLVFTSSRVSVRAEVAFTTAVLAFSVWSEARVWFREQSSKWVPILAGALLICLPLVQDATDQEMAESLLTLFCFWSAVYFGRFLDSKKLSDSLFFSLYFSLAVLTKGSGWMLAILPLVAMLLTRKLELLRSLSLWAGAALVAALCLPWQLITLKSAARGWTGGSTPSVQYTVGALVQFAVIFIEIAGPILSVLVVLGIVVTVVRPLLRERRTDSVPAVMFGLILSDWLFHSLVPAGVEDRKMILAVPALIYFLFAGGIWFADRIWMGARFSRFRRPFITGTAVVVFATQVFAIPHIRHYGYSEAAQYLLSEGYLKHGTVLVSSESGGEGMLISEVAMRDPRPENVVARATKELAVVDWNGGHYQSLFSTPDELLHYLQRRRVQLLVTDTYPPQVPFLHQRLLEQTIASHPEDFKLLHTFSDSSRTKGQVEVYQVLQGH